jgi:hypothetical protein
MCALSLPFIQGESSSGDHKAMWTFVSASNWGEPKRNAAYELFKSPAKMSDRI